MVSPIAGNQDFTAVDTHAAQIPSVSAGSVSAQDVDAFLVGGGSLSRSDVVGDPNPTILSGNPVLIGDCCGLESLPQIEIRQLPQTSWAPGLNGGEILIGALLADPAGGPVPLMSKIGFFGAPPVEQPTLALAGSTTDEIVAALVQLGLAVGS